MAKVFGIHQLALLPGVKAEDFEQFFRDVASHVPKAQGWTWYLLRGDRGEREDKYVLLAEIESVETRDRTVPASGELPPETQQWFQETAPIFEKWATFASGPTDPAFTDYVVVGEWSDSSATGSTGA